MAKGYEMFQKTLSRRRAMVGRCSMPRLTCPSRSSAIYPILTKIRSSPVSNVLLTDADLDHVMRLLLMRENDTPLQVTAFASVRWILSEEFSLGAILKSFCGIEWTDIGADECKIIGSLQVRSVFLKCRKPPRYSKQPECDAAGCLITDPATKRTAGFFPDVSYLDDDLLAIFRQCDALFLDGTFWSESEMQELKISQSSATEMGHLPISGEDGSLMKVAPLQRPLCSARRRTPHAGTRMLPRPTLKPWPLSALFKMMCEKCSRFGVLES